MKILNDGTEVSDRSYQYLVHFISDQEDDAVKFLPQAFSKQNLENLTANEYWFLFEMATKNELPFNPNKEKGFVILKGDYELDEIFKVRNHILNHHEPEHLTFPEMLINPFAELPTPPIDLMVKEHQLTTGSVQLIGKNFSEKTKRVRGESNKAFKQSIRNLTNKKK